jgi:hypothetical protein
MTKENRMRIMLTVVALIAVMTSDKASAEVLYPWCAVYGYFGVTNCGFATLQQCRAAISGNGGFCRENGFYFEAVTQAPPVRSRRLPR